MIYSYAHPIPRDENAFRLRECTRHEYLICDALGVLQIKCCCYKATGLVLWKRIGLTQIHEVL